MFRIRHSLYFVLFCLIGCGEEQANRSVFQTEAVSGITTRGAVFNGDIKLLGGATPSDYGFVWSTFPNPTTSDFSYSFDQKPVPGKFSFNLDFDLAPLQNYYVRAFLKTATSVIYANPVSFQSLGATGPVITDFTPKEGTPGTEITITGKNFNEVNTANKVNIGSQPVIVKSSTRNQIIFTIPNSYITGKYRISVETIGNINWSTDSLKLIGPLISGFSPSSGLGGSQVIISGSGFSPNVSGNTVSFAGLAAQVIAATSQQITVLVPDVPSVGPADIQVTSNSLTAITNDKFNVIGPELISFAPTSGAKGTMVVITGTNFSAVPANNIVKFTYVQAVVTAATTTQLTVLVPIFYTTGVVPVTVEVHGVLSTAPSKFTVVGPEITSFTPLSEYPGRTLTITGKNFSSIQSDNSVSFQGVLGTVLSSSETQITVEIPMDLLSSDFSKLPVPITVSDGYLSGTSTTLFTPLSPWVAVQPFPGESRIAASGFTIGSFAYVGTGLGVANDLNDFWQYDAANDAWTRKADFPGGPRAWSFSFALNGKGYFAGGDHYTSGVNGPVVLFDMWEYDPATDLWTRKQDYPSLITDPNHNPTAMALGSKAYVLDDEDLYVYDPSLDQWTKKSNSFLASGNSRCTSFVIGNVGYIGNGYNSLFWKYDLSTDTWTQIADFPNGALSRAPAFAINGKGYAGSGPYYEYDPVANTWTRILDNDEGPYAYSVSFSINGYGYVTTGAGGIPATFRYNPNY